MTFRVNYDEIAPHYDECLRDHPVDRDLLAFLVARGLSPEHVRILDIGCGTGKQMASNRAHLPGITTVGLDRFRGMLRIARTRCPDALLVQADGARFPFADAAFEYVSSQFSYQHIRNTPGLVSEAFRVLTAGGRFVMTNIDPWSMPGWLVYRYFPDAAVLDRGDFDPVDEFVAMMRSAGFERIQSLRKDVSKEERLADFFDYASQRHRASQMMAISDAAYAQGLRKLEHDVRESGGEGMARSEFVFVTVCGEKPPMRSDEI